MAIVFFTESVLGTSFVSQDYGIPSEMQQLLESLQKRGIQIGLVLRPPDKSGETSNDSLKRANRFFDTKLTIFKNLPIEQRLAEAVAKAKVFQGPALFVGKHSAERKAALQAGFDGVVPHPQLISEGLDGEPLIYARVSGVTRNQKDGLTKFLQLPIVPVYFSRRTETAYVITSLRTKELIVSLGFEIVMLGKERDPELTDLYLVTGERKVQTTLPERQIARGAQAERHEPRFGLETPDGLLLALTADFDIHAFNINFLRDGHSKRLLPDPTLLAALEPDTVFSRPCPTAGSATALTVDELNRLQDLIQPETIRSFHADYVGHEILVTGGT